jgi:hypothetical protein
MRLYCLLVVAVLFLCCQAARAGGLELIVRPQIGRVVCGDPLYLEVTFINRSEATITGPIPHPDLNTIDIFLRDLNAPDSVPRRKQAAYGARADGKTVDFEPGKPVTFYWYVFLPGVGQFDDAFWAPIRGGGKISIIATYREGEVELGWTRKAEFIQVVPRDGTEMHALERIARRQDLVNADMPSDGPCPSDFGLVFLRNAKRNETETFASQIKTGELADMLQLSIRLQDIHAIPPSERESTNRLLVEWLEKQPDIMRATLIQQIRSIAERHGLLSTAKALKRVTPSR